MYEAKLNSYKNNFKLKKNIKRVSVLAGTPQGIVLLRERGTVSPGLGCAGNYALPGMYYFCFYTRRRTAGSGSPRSPGPGEAVCSRPHP